MEEVKNVGTKTAFTPFVFLFNLFLIAQNIHGFYFLDPNDVGLCLYPMSSNVGMVEVGVDMTTSAPSSTPLSFHPSAFATPRSFHALKEKCSLKIEFFSKFRDRFQFPNETRARFPRKGEKACTFAHGEVCFYEAAFLCGLRFPIHPFIMELLHYLNLALEQLMPNSWRIVISCMVIWTTNSA